MQSRKPMAAARQVALFEREVRWKLSAAAIEILFEVAELLSEGERRGTGYFGSTMITIDLARAAGAVREACDAASAQRVAELIAQDPRVRERARLLAVADAEERAGAPLTAAKTELRARATGAQVFLDVDVEAGVTAQQQGRAAT